MIKRFKIGLDLITIEDTSKEYGALSQDEVVDLLNALHEEKEHLKQLIHTMLMQIDAENIGDENAIYSARIIFAKKDFKLLKAVLND